MTLARYALWVLGLLGATFVPALLALGERLDAASRRAATFGAGLAALNTLAAYALVRWSRGRSPRTFLAAVLGGMVGRMGLMLAAVVAGILALGLPEVPLAVSLLSYFVVFLTIEIAVLQRHTTPAQSR